jgi:hypothetical protein
MILFKKEFAHRQLIMHSAYGIGPNIANLVQIICPDGYGYVGPIRFVRRTKAGLCLIESDGPMPWSEDWYGYHWMNHKNPDGSYRHSVPLHHLFRTVDSQVEFI